MVKREFPEAIDSTMLSSLICDQEFLYAHVESWHLEKESIHLHAGAAYAKGMEVARKTFFVTGDREAAEDAGIQALMLAYGDFPAGDEAKNLPRMIGAMEFYFDNFPLDTDHAKIALLGDKPGIEFSFAIPLPIRHPDTGNPLLFAGRCDAIVEYAGGRYALDDKTTSALGASWAKQWEMRGQFAGYAWAMREHGLKPSGTIVRGVSILKTKYDKAEAIISQPDYKIDRWYESSLRKIERMIELYLHPEKAIMNFGEACNAYGSCPYKQACLSRDPYNWLETYYTYRPWRPLERH